MVFCWRADDGPTLNGGFVVFQGIQTSITKKPIIFCDFSEGEGGSGQIIKAFLIYLLLI